MKIVFTTSGTKLNAPLDSRFGRAPNLLVFDLDSGTYEVVDNQENLNAAEGAGIRSAETVGRLGGKALVTGNCGPRAFHVLLGAGIKVFKSDGPTVADALEQYRAGKLAEVEALDVEGHWE